jgi:hypothetical protein
MNCKIAARPSDQATQEQCAADAYREMCETSQRSVASYVTWLRVAGPDRLEAKGRSPQLRHLAMLHTKGAGI